MKQHTLWIEAYRPKDLENYIGNDELKDLDKNEGLGSTAWDRAKASYYSLKRRYKAARKAWSDN